MTDIPRAAPAFAPNALNDPRLSVGERTQSKLRLAMAELDKQLQGLATAAPVGDVSSSQLCELGAAWRAVVEVLALEPEPERRACPHCAGPIRLQATRCVYCWKKSVAG